MLSGLRLLMELYNCHLSPGKKIPVIHPKSEPPAPGRGSLCNFSPGDSGSLPTHVHPTAPRVRLGKSRRSVPGSGPQVPLLCALTLLSLDS